MISLLLSLLAAAPSAPSAKALAASKSWDELYLAFAASSPKAFLPADRRAISRALQQGCEALSTSDPPLAFSLGDRALAFEHRPDAVLCFSVAALATDQRGAAEAPLRAAVKANPKDGRLALLLGRLYLEERDPRRALEALARVPPRSGQRAQAQALLQKARSELAAEAAALTQARRDEASLAAGKGSGVSNAPPKAGNVGALSYESGVGEGGLRTRSNARFHFKYFNRERDFGQRAEYEGQVAGALEQAYLTTRRVLGAAREHPVDVVLYSKEEFSTHHGEGTSRVVAGFYSAGAIRVNDAAAINAENAGTLVHEYVHAFLDDHTSDRGRAIPLWLNEGTAEYVEWQFKGWDGPPKSLALALKGAAKTHRLPSLAEMSSGTPLLAQPNPVLRYAFSAMAVRLMVSKGGAAKLLDLVREVAAGAPFSSAFEARYAQPLERFEEELTAEVARL